MRATGQSDSLKSVPSSWAFTAGLNLVYPLADQYRTVSESTNPSYGFDLVVRPKTAYSPWFALDYCRAFSAGHKNALSYVLGLGFTQYTFKTISTGWVIKDFPPYGDSGTFYSDHKINTLNMGMGIESESELSKSIRWNNQLSVSVHYGFNLNSNRTVSMYDMFLNYKTGVEFHITKNVYISPSLSSPLLSLNGIQRKYTGREYFACIKSGITLILCR
jgi:hypothetical protein